VRHFPAEPRQDKTPKAAAARYHAQPRSGFRTTAVRTGVPLFLQAKLSVSQPGDSFEQEADRVAESVMRMNKPASIGKAPAAIRRKCAICEDESDDKIQTKREERSRNWGVANAAPASVERVLSSSGAPLEPLLHDDMEQRFGHDFSRVRVHSGAAAEQSAREVNAQAYTVGHNIVFGADRFAPRTHAGRRLIAHELTHVVQQRAAARVLQRELDVEDFEGGDFSIGTLKAYLSKFGPGRIEGNDDSDDKARTIVRLWRTKKLDLNAKNKILLIQEMQDGPTYDEDERAILTLLLHSWDEDIREIFSAKGGIDPADLDTDFQTAEEDELRRFFDRKFVGGREAALEGSRKLRKAKTRKDKPKASAGVPRKGGGGKERAPPLWTVDELKKMLDACDGGLGIWAKAKKANKDKDPEIVRGDSGRMYPATGTITLDKTQDTCFAVQQLILELSNLSRAADVVEQFEAAAAGGVAREDFIRGLELLEYETGVKNVLTAFDACKDKWRCETTPKESARKAKDFDDYFENVLEDTHKERLGKWWDTHCKAAYDENHAKK